ncbi:imidazole glycerol phosphate synthase subunit HisF [Candidatus Vidania fulgoroideae]|uniref:imidazole glycerol-phosphate synthase n=1 Tax=Candidatus Vidania fulgoroideorum TaxID=881286 RepID=A0A975AEG4_9PROT|nr:imidazole glycerol phosphate synthase subunit HisF [Candidatus Vidania fulgoroideae]
MVNRIVACLDIMGNYVYKGVSFENMKLIGDARSIAYKYYLDYADELVILNINKSSISSLINLLRDISRMVFIPITFGGNIRTYKDIELLLNNGADRVCLNSTLYYNNDILSYISNRYGKQCIVGSIDVSNNSGLWYVYFDGGKKKTNIQLSDWISLNESRGIGEILLTSIDRDGTGHGYDINLINYASKISNVPIIASGGVGGLKDIESLFKNTNVKAALVASYLHRGNITVRDIKRKLSGSYYVRL